MQRQPSKFMIYRTLAIAALHAVLAANLYAQAPMQADPASELTFDDVRPSARKNPLNLFNLQPSPASNVPQASSRVEPRTTATQLTLHAQPPATTPPVTLNSNSPVAAIASPGDTSAPAREEIVQGVAIQPVLDANRENVSAKQDSTTESLESIENIQQRDTFTPLQSRALSTRILAVNVSMQDLGTGLLPEGSDRNNQLQPILLPTGYERGAAYKVVQWQPSMICHYPLYFEDAMLERHGHVRFGCFQSLAAGAKFFGTLPLLPYLHTLKPKHECQYALGHYRAGSQAPLVRDHLPWDRKAAVVEALAWSSFFWAAPL